MPGSGKIYSGEWQDGLLAFSMIAATGLQSYIGFKKNGIESFSGWFFGTLGFGFYIGNITGSIKSANKYNFKKNEIIRLKVKDILFDL